MKAWLSIFLLGFSINGYALEYSDCNKYDMSGEAFGASDPKAAATALLNGALFRETIDAITPAEVTARDWCVNQALAKGANPNNTSGPGAPLILAVSNSDEVAVRALLKYRANPNVSDSGMAVAGTPTPVLNTACQHADDNIVLALLAAGANPVPEQPLWLSASAGDDIAVHALLNTGKIPVNQLSNFGLDASGAQTALDASEQRLDAIKTYFSKTQGKAAADKIDYINNTIIYGYYIGLTRLSGRVEPDQFMQKLQSKQQNVSSLLKAKGWVCHEANCGIDVSADAGADALSPMDSSQNQAN